MNEVSVHTVNGPVPSGQRVIRVVLLSPLEDRHFSDHIPLTYIDVYILRCVPNMCRMVKTLGWHEQGKVVEYKCCVYLEENVSV